MTLSRRRFLAICAAATTTMPAQAAPVNRFHFQALGADCRITLPGDPGRADQAIGKVRADVEAIEQAFSLYRADSELSLLNRQGHLPHPSETFLEGLQLAQDISNKTAGTFDVTVQSRWKALATKHSVSRTRIDWRALQMHDDGVRFASPGMSATFNGIAQGIATDRAIATLQLLGYRNVLANLGEFRALGDNPNGNPWQIGVQNPMDGQISNVLSPTPEANAIATSEPHGTLIAGAPHIFDPLNRVGPRWSSVTVRAASAAAADAISTALAASPISSAKALLNAGNAQEAILIDANGRSRHWRA